MLHIKKNEFYQILLILIIIFSNCTGLLQIIGGSVFAEGSIILLTFFLMIMLVIDKTTIGKFDIIMLFIAIYSIFITVIRIINNEIELTSLICFYSYLLPSLIFINRKHNFFKNNANIFFKVFTIMILINALYAIFQRFCINAIIPLEFNRARGLMKTTLNFSGIIGVMFFPIISYFTTVKNKLIVSFTVAMILIGSIFSLSRGLFANLLLGFAIAPFFQTFILKKYNKQIIIKYIGTAMIAILAFMFILIILNQLGILEQFDRLLHIFDYQNDKANTIRTAKWSNFFDYFIAKPFGYGVGQIDSGTIFVSKPVNFESYILDTVYSIGLLSIPYFLIPVIYIYKNISICSLATIQYASMFVIGIFVQNLVQPSMLTPTTLICTWLTICFFANYLQQIDYKIKSKRNFHAKT